MGSGDYSLVSDGYLGKAVKASKRTAFWNSLSLDLTKFESGSEIHIHGMMKILAYPENKSAKANIVVKNENGEQKSFRIIGQTTLDLYLLINQNKHPEEYMGPKAQRWTRKNSLSIEQTLGYFCRI